MRAHWTQEGNKLTFGIELSADDTTGPYRNYAGARKLHMLASRSFYVVLPDGMDLNEAHPDLLALTIIVTLNYFIGKELLLPVGISQELHDEYFELTGKRVLPVDDKLKPRKPPRGSTAALAFSGGVDSTAALTIMPNDTKMIFLDRAEKDIRRYNKAAAKQSCALLQRMGREVYTFESDVEYLLEPTTLTHALTACIPAILTADYLKIDAIATGNILENIYGLEFENRFVGKSPTTLFDALFAVAGVPAAHVTAGLTEVATTNIVTKSDFRQIAQSCMYGQALAKPCLNCIKCFRKTIIEDICRGKVTDNKLLDDLLDNDDVDMAFRKLPLSMQDPYMYLAAFTTSTHPILGLMKRKLGGSKSEVSWMSCWYEPSKYLVPDKYRSVIAQNIKKCLAPMDSNQEQQLKKWDLTSQKRSLIRKYWHAKFWKGYSKRYGRTNITFGRDSIAIELGNEVNLKALAIRPFWTKHNISNKVKWSSNNKNVATISKSGRITAISKGEATIYAKYGRSRARVLVEVGSA